MSYTLNKMFIFATGCIIGSVVTWKLLKDKYERIANEEIESVKKVFSNKEKTSNNESEKNTVERNTGDKATDELNEKLVKLGYVNYSDISKEEEGGSDMTNKPYVIKPEEFGEEFDYDAETLRYYADGVLADDWGNVIDNVDELVGVESLTHFGEYEEDSVFVRNDDLKSDYEILLDLRNYSDICSLNSNGEYDE